MESSVRSAKDVELVLVDDHDVSGSSGWGLVDGGYLLPLRYLCHCDRVDVRGFDVNSRLKNMLTAVQIENPHIIHE